MVKVPFRAFYFLYRKVTVVVDSTVFFAFSRKYAFYLAFICSSSPNSCYESEGLFKKNKEYADKHHKNLILTKAGIERP